MKKSYIQFIDNNGIDILGTVIFYDCRLKLENIKKVAEDYYKKSNNIFICGMTIFKKNKAIYSDYSHFIQQKKGIKC